MLRGLTLFPGGAQMIAPRMKTGKSNRTGEIIGWGHYDPQEERMTDKIDTFFQFAPSVQRAQERFINIYPITEFQGWLSFYNLPHLLNRYSVLEFYWFTTDFYGHYLGERLHNASLRRFDYWFGVMVNQLDLDRVNIVLAEKYQGEYLDIEEWLCKTLYSSYPGAITNIYNLAQNPHSGDVINVIILGFQLRS